MCVWGGGVVALFRVVGGERGYRWVTNTKIHNTLSCERMMPCIDKAVVYVFIEEEGVCVYVCVGGRVFGVGE